MLGELDGIDVLLQQLSVSDLLPSGLAWEGAGGGRKKGEQRSAEARGERSRCGGQRLEDEAQQASRPWWGRGLQPICFTQAMKDPEIAFSGSP